MKFIGKWMNIEKNYATYPHEGGDSLTQVKGK